MNWLDHENSPRKRPPLSHGVQSVTYSQCHFSVSWIGSSIPEIDPRFRLPGFNLWCPKFRCGCHRLTGFWINRWRNKIKRKKKKKRPSSARNPLNRKILDGWFTIGTLHDKIGLTFCFFCREESQISAKVNPPTIIQSPNTASTTQGDLYQLLRSQSEQIASLHEALRKLILDRSIDAPSTNKTETREIGVQTQPFGSPKVVTDQATQCQRDDKYVKWARPSPGLITWWVNFST